jgi:uncharacterized protein
MEPAFKQPEKNLRCPSCDMLVEYSPSNRSLPFCSQRCRLVDLGRWLNEEHTLPFDPDSDEQQESESSAGSGGPVLPPGWHDA